MATTGKDILGASYTASCENLRSNMAKTKDPAKGDIVFFTGTRHAGANHVGIVYKVDTSNIYTIEGNTSGGTSVIDNGGEVCKKCYNRNYGHILSYARPKYTKSYTAAMLIKIASGEVGYMEKASAKNEDSKTANAGDKNYTKYGKWLGMDGQYWCCAFVSWCFDQLCKSSTKTVVVKKITATVKTSGGALRIRKSKSTDAAILGTIPNGTKITVTEKGDEWSKVKYVDQVGYCSNKYLKF